MFAILYALGMFVADMFKSRRGVNPILVIGHMLKFDEIDLLA
jgi:hypothetical protein